MKVVGVVKDDYAYAAWNLFQALRFYGVDATLINIAKRNPQIVANPEYYDVKLWNPSERARVLDLINTADVYHIFESGNTFNFLHKLPCSLNKTTPVIVSLNDRRFYLSNADLEIEKVLNKASIVTSLTLGIQHKDVVLGLQCLNESDYCDIPSYSFKTGTFLIGSAPGYAEAARVKKIKVIAKHIKNIDNVKFEILIKKKRTFVKNAMLNSYDAFTHGISFSGGYGFSMLEAAMLGVPCFTYINERQSHLIELDGKLPILNLKPDCSNMLKIIEALRDTDTRQYYGELIREWARKFHSRKASYTTYTKLYRELI